MIYILSLVILSMYVWGISLLPHITTTLYYNGIIQYYTEFCYQLIIQLCSVIFMTFGFNTIDLNTIDWSDPDKISILIVSVELYAGFIREFYRIWSGKISHTVWLIRYDSYRNRWNFTMETYVLLTVDFVHWFTRVLWFGSLWTKKWKI